MLTTTDLLEDYPAHRLCITQALKYLSKYHSLTPEELREWSEDEELINSLIKKLDNYFKTYKVFLQEGEAYAEEIDWIWEDNITLEECFGHRGVDLYGELVAYSSSGECLYDKNLEILTENNDDSV